MSNGPVTDGADREHTSEGKRSWFGLGPRRTPGKPRPHPYAGERSTAREAAIDPRVVTYTALGLATAMTIMGLLLQDRFSPYSAGWFGGYGSGGPSMAWDQWTLVPLFSGLALLGFGFNRQAWSKRLTMVGWVLFAFYWALTATDLLVKEDQDYVNFLFAIVGVFFFTYLAYHQWLSLVREVNNDAVHFLNVTAFIAAGTYFLIAKIQVLRVWLITVVGEHTKWMLDLFGQGTKKNLQFHIDKTDPTGPVMFHYPETYCSVSRGGDAVEQFCRTLPPSEQYRNLQPVPEGFWQELLFTNQSASGVIPVSIILACTAVQSIMLFVGLFAGTQAPWQKKLKFSLIVGSIVYVLNLVRNTGIIWFYGQGHASFWTMHNAVGKGGSLLAMIAIAFGVFRGFPEFFKSLVGVLDLPERDGPIERTLNIGRRRPPIDGLEASDD